MSSPSLFTSLSDRAVTMAANQTGTPTGCSGRGLARHSHILGLPPTFRIYPFLKLPYFLRQLALPSFSCLASSLLYPTVHLTYPSLQSPCVFNSVTSTSFSCLPSRPLRHYIPIAEALACHFNSALFTALCRSLLSPSLHPFPRLPPPRLLLLLLCRLARPGPLLTDNRCPLTTYLPFFLLSFCPVGDPFPH